MNGEKQNIESLLEQNGFYSFFPTGTSMLPLIVQGQDSVIVKSKSGRLKKYDIALYRRRNGVYVLHRVVQVKADGYTMCGDHQYEYEYGVGEDQVLGVLTELFKNGQVFDLDSKEYKYYVKKTVFLQPLKRIGHRIFKRKK